MERIGEYHKERRKEIFVEENGQQYSIMIYYDMGGMNYFSYKVEERGYYISVSPVKVSFNPNGAVMTKTIRIYSGLKKLIKPAHRFSAAELDFQFARHAQVYLSKEVMELFQEVFTSVSQEGYNTP